MTPATASPTDADQAGRPGLLAFAAVLLLIIGFCNVLYGVAAIRGSDVFATGVHYAVAGLYTWGWVTVMLGVAQLVAFGGVRAGNQLARWFAVAAIAVNIVGQLMSVPGYPFWSLTIVAVDVVAMFGLCAHGGARV